MKLFLLHFPAIQFKGIDPCSHEGTWGQDYGWTPASSARVPATRPSLCGPGWPSLLISQAFSLPVLESRSE